MYHTKFESDWYDTGGDCAALTYGADVILNGSGTLVGSSTEFDSENEVAFLDNDDWIANKQ